MRPSSYGREKKGRENNEVEERTDNPNGCRGRDECRLLTLFLQTGIFRIHEFWAKSNLTWVTLEYFSFYQGKQNIETGSELKTLGIH